MQGMKVVGLICFVGICAGGASFAATRYVNVSNATPAAPYSTVGSAATNIQQAVDAAVNGDEILVSPGVYRIRTTVLMPFSKTLTLRSTQSRAAVIDAQRLCRALEIRGSNNLVEGFTIRNGMEPSFGGGIYMISPSTVRDCLVVSNQAWGAGGICIYASGTLVENCTIQSNVATWGGGVLFYNYSTGVMNRCVISGNFASNYCGGIGFQGAGTVSNSWIADNRALGSAGGVEMDGGRLINSVVVGNRAQTEGGGVYASKGYLAHCTVVSNTAGEENGGLYFSHSTSWNSIVYFNVAQTNANFFTINSIFNNNCTTPSEGGSNFTNAPTFVNFAARDFHLTANSSCVERGAPNPAVNIDYEGTLRPQMATLAGSPEFDVGAFEYQMGWDAGYTDIGNGWRRLTWFGDYVPMGGAGWIWHNQHGFWYAAPASTSYDIWFFTNDMGWLWTGSTTYPFLYRASDGAWLWYNGATNPRWFRNMTAGTWESRP